MADTNSKTAAVLISQVSVPPISLRRRMVDHAMTGVAVLSVGLVLVPLFAIFAHLVYRGIGSVHIVFLNPSPTPGGQGGRCSGESTRVIAVLSSGLRRAPVAPR